MNLDPEILRTAIAAAADHVRGAAVPHWQVRHVQRILAGLNALARDVAELQKAIEYESSKRANKRGSSGKSVGLFIAQSRGVGPDRPDEKAHPV